MKDSPLFKQAELLLRILPILNRESIFALKGGTAINFFVRDLPRLSVDIDLVYLPIKGRDQSLLEISSALITAEENILKLIPGTKSYRKTSSDYTIGLIIRTDSANVKIEPNTVIRGTVYKPVEYNLCTKGEELFELSVKINSLTVEELYAGKICAALDRQHPRDLYDIKLLLENEGITEPMRKAFIVYLISHNRPIAELLRPNLTDIKEIYKKEFVGMALDKVELDELISVREILIKKINNSLIENEREFLISFKSLEPKWDLLGLAEIEKLPAVKWKLINLRKMDKKRHLESLRILANCLMKKI
ncbi:MAG: nucleotidyl transferase AbiEii/AbiGii toxin family protein [Melioribacteraceae bacterium]